MWTAWVRATTAPATSVPTRISSSWRRLQARSTNPTSTIHSAFRTVPSDPSASTSTDSTREYHSVWSVVYVCPFLVSWFGFLRIPLPKWPGADWAALLPGTCQVGRLVRRQGGPATSNVEVGQTTYPLTGVGQGWRGENWARNKVTRREEREERSRSVALSWDGGLYTWIFVQGPTEFLVTQLLMGPVCLVIPGLVWRAIPLLKMTWTVSDGALNYSLGPLQCVSTFLSEWKPSERIYCSRNLMQWHAGFGLFRIDISIICLLSV